MRFRRLTALMLILAPIGAEAAKLSNDFFIVSIPIGTVKPDTVVWVKWAGTSRNPLLPTYLAPDSGYIYYSRSPGGGALKNYANRVNRPYTDSVGGRLVIHDNEYTHPTLESPVAVRASAFRPVDQRDMGSGVFYCVVALPLQGDTLVSNEFQILVESPDKVERIGPVGDITALTPTFSWKANPGVPYYHIILSDEPISFDTSSGNINLQGLSIIWQAITPDNQMVYGAPDPSKTITADPPPLSPGTHYTWVVLNNYGNQPMFSSFRSAKLPPSGFTVTGTSLTRPKNVYPAPGAALDNVKNEKFSFSWTNLDAKANTYKIYVYVGADFSGVLAGVNAKMAVWQTEVRATAGRDTMSVSIDASSILTNNKYLWRVMAVDDKGAGTAGDTSSFNYSSQTGTMGLFTRENIPVAHDGKVDTIVTAVGLVQASVEVLSGAMEAPLLFYTDNSGNLERTRPAGSYRVTMIKDGYENLAKTIVLGADDTTRDTFFLKRPESSIFGRVVDESNKGINLATVRAVSDRNDTVTAKSDGLGNFVLNCYGADWQVGFEMEGYRPLLPRKITVEPGKSFDFGMVIMQKNPYTLSGTVVNTGQAPLLGVKVQLLHDGVVVGEMPSTPQTGLFAFSIPAGTYTLTAEKVGFTSYSSPIEIASSRNVTVAMAPRATLVAGYVYGKSVVNGQSLIAPITSANIYFVNSSGDTLAAGVDAVYGNFHISLPGNRRFTVWSAATGYAPKGRLDTIATGDLANVTYNDTLTAFALIAGTVKTSAAKAALGDVGVTLVRAGAGTIAASAKSSANGYFEFRGIVDGIYTVTAGKDGFVLDSAAGGDTIRVTGGNPSPGSIGLFMKPGDKTVKWAVRGTGLIAGQIKILSPMVKTITIGDSLARAGAGGYIVTVDAAADTLIDLAFHRFAVPDGATLFTDTVALNVSRRKTDTLFPSLDGTVSLTVSSADALDSAALYFKDAAGSAWQSQRKNVRARAYVFSFVPPKDGSTMQYFFTAARGSDVYGYDKESFYAFVAPDTVRLSKLEITPFSSDTLRFPTGSDALFSLKGYYSAAFLPASIRDSAAVSWRLADSQGCSLVKSRGLDAQVRTASSRSARPIVLTAAVDTTKLRLKAGVSPQQSVPFLVSGGALASITVKRVDAKSPGPISTAIGDRAEFIAQGSDKLGTKVNLSPAWSVQPSSAGSIGDDGVFRPAPRFLGAVRIFAAAAGLQGEYTPETQSAAGGLNVQHIVPRKATPDTASNEAGLSLVFPPNIVGGNDIGLIDLSTPPMRNLIQRGFTDVRMIDSSAYDITELQKATFTFAHDSIRLTLSIPAPIREEAAAGKRRISIARWNADSLLWNPLGGTLVAAGGKTASVNLAHFSRYAVVAPPKGLSVDVSVSPNPFSPKVRPQGAGSPLGTRIAVRPEMPEVRLQYIDIRIYNIVGDQVWALQIPNAQPMQYAVWWDGTTTTRVESGDPNRPTITVQGDRLCRNGRYFVVVTVKDYNNKEKKVMKPIVLVK
jgi:hypothetical protein